MKVVSTNAGVQPLRGFSNNQVPRVPDPALDVFLILPLLLDIPALSAFPLESFLFLFSFLGGVTSYCRLHVRSFIIFASYLNKNDFGGLIIGRIPPNTQSCVTRSSLLVRNDLGCVCVLARHLVSQRVSILSLVSQSIFMVTPQRSP